MARYRARFATKGRVGQTLVTAGSIVTATQLRALKQIKQKPIETLLLDTYYYFHKIIINLRELSCTEHARLFLTLIFWRV